MTLDSTVRTSIALVGILAAGACGGSTSPAPDSIVGAYQLRMVNGGNLPFSYESGGTKAVVNGDALVIAAGGKWTEQASITVTTGGSTVSQVLADSGTWTHSGASVTLFSTPKNSTRYSGAFSGGVLTVSDGMFAYAFSR